MFKLRKYIRSFVEIGDYIMIMLDLEGDFMYVLFELLQIGRISALLKGTRDSREKEALRRDTYIANTFQVWQSFFSFLSL
jgi:hypothetical protein